MFKNKNLVSSIIFLVVGAVALFVSMICMHMGDETNLIIFQVVFWASLVIGKILDVDMHLDEIEKKIDKLEER